MLLLGTGRLRAAPDINKHFVMRADEDGAVTVVDMDPSAAEVGGRVGGGWAGAEVGGWTGAEVGRWVLR